MLDFAGRCLSALAVALTMVSGVGVSIKLDRTWYGPGHCLMVETMGHYTM